MEFPTQPPRVDLAAHLQGPAARLPKRATSTPPETALPVLATPPASLPAPIKGLGIAPLDLFQVGDNDDIPLPPDPPRRSAALAIIASMPEPEPEPDASPAASAAPPTPDPAPVPAPDANPAPPVPHGDTLHQLLTALAQGSSPPSVDIRS